MNDSPFRYVQGFSNIMPASMRHSLEESYYTASHIVFEQASNQQKKITGILDKKLIPLFQPLVSQIHYVGIDPNQEACILFEENVSSLQTQNVSISAHVTQLENYETEQRFDLTLMVHVLYYFSNPYLPILTSYNLLKPKGKAVIVVALDDALNSFFKEVWRSMCGYQPCLSPTVESILLEREISYEKYSILAQINVTECFIQGSEVGEQLLSFIFHSDIRKMPASNKRELTDYLVSMSYQENGKLYVPHPADIYIMEKTF